jgi:hypothetical protein
MQHPLLFFNDSNGHYANQTSCFVNRAYPPCSTWYSVVANQAPDSNHKYSGMVYDALMWQLTGNTARRDRAISQLKLVSAESFTSGCSYGDTCLSRPYKLQQYLLTYDWIQPSLSTADDTEVRNNLAKYTDEVYYDLNHVTGYPTTWVATADAHLRMYAGVGMAGIVLKDYSGTLPHLSKASDWEKVGTTYLFADDHVIHGTEMTGTGMLQDELGHGPQGRDVWGTYEWYWAHPMYPLLMALDYTNRTLRTRYPVLHNYATSHIFMAMPLGNYPNYVAEENACKGMIATAYMGMMDLPEQAAALWTKQQCDWGIARMKYAHAINTYDYYDVAGYQSLGTENNDLRAVAHPEIALVTYPYNSSLAAAPPVSTAYTGWDYTYSSIRSDWTTNAAWIGMMHENVTKNPLSNQRPDYNQDSLSVSYHAKGDVVVEESSESESNSDTDQEGKYKGVLLFASGLTQTPSAVWKGSASQGDNPATQPDISQYYSGGPVEFVEGVLPGFNKVSTVGTTGLWTQANTPTLTTFSDTLKWTRAIMMVDRDYAVIIDFVNNTLARRISLNLPLATYNHPPGGIGIANYKNVVGALSVDGTAVNWGGQSPRNYVYIKDANGFNWTTTNVEGISVMTQGYSAPAGAFFVQRDLASLGGKDSDGYSMALRPVIRLDFNLSKPMGRVTILKTILSGGTPYTMQENPITGGYGSSVSVTNGIPGGFIDYLHVGNGSLVSFNGMSTDAMYSVSRNASGFRFALLRGGSTYAYAGTPYVKLDRKVDFVMLALNGSNAVIESQNSVPVNGTFQVQCSSNTRITRDGVMLASGWGCTTEGTVWIMMPNANKTHYGIIQ